MRYNLLGNTGVLVSEISLGAMTFGRSGNWSVFGSLDEKAAGRLVDQALDAGLTFSIPPIFMRTDNPKRFWEKR
ncbi:hypothetical protein LJK88_45750 [Paenibacillus sp. P26]|nr:hypothetical protein LJK88_45750 [Paenibacillus sp. P26]